MIPNLIQYVKSIGIIVTKSNTDDQEEILESLYEAFYQHKHFIEVVVSAGNIVSLPRPHKENIGKDLPNDYFKSVKQMIQKLRSTEFTQIQSIMENNARQYIDSQVNQIINNLQNQFNQTYQQLENFISSFKKVHHTTTQYENSLNQLKNIKKDLPVNNDQDNIQKILDSINSVMQSFSKFINQSQNIKEVNKNIITLKDFCLLCPLNDSNSQPILQFNKNISYKIDDGINLLKSHIEAQKQRAKAQRQKEAAQLAFREIRELKDKISQLKKEIQQKDLRSKVMEEIAQLNNLYQEKKYDNLIQQVNDFETKEKSFNEINQSEEYKSFYFLASKAYFRQNNKRLDEYLIKAQKDKYLRKAQKNYSELTSCITKEDKQSDFEKQQQRALEDLIKQESKWTFSNDEKTYGELKTPDFTYEGDCYQGYRYGQGKQFDKQGQLEYDGSWSEDFKQGKGCQIYSCGEYNGDFVKDQSHGDGTFTCTNGDTYEGQQLKWFKERIRNIQRIKALYFHSKIVVFYYQL